MDETEQNRLRRERAIENFENDFEPNTRGPVENQQVTALNYIAYQMGQIKQALRRIADAAERQDPS
jgi:hypothetical protein